MRFNYYVILLLVLAFMGLTFAAASTYNSSPKSLADVAVLAEQKGLYWVDGRVRLPSNRIIISTRPLEPEEAAAVNIAVPRKGMASCYLKLRHMSVHYDPANSIVWGDVFLYGDPAVISALTGISPRS